MKENQKACQKITPSSFSNARSNDQMIEHHFSLGDFGARFNRVLRNEPINKNFVFGLKWCCFQNFQNFRTKKIEI